MNNLLKDLFKNAEIPHIASYEVLDADDEGTTFIGEAQALEEANLIFAQEDKFADGLRTIIALDQNGHMFGNKEIRSEWVEATQHPPTPSQPNPQHQPPASEPKLPRPFLRPKKGQVMFSMSLSPKLAGFFSPKVSSGLLMPFSTKTRSGQRKV